MRIINKKASFDFALERPFIEAGVSLKGIEAGSLLRGRGDLSSSYIRFIGNELFLVNANIPANGSEKYDATRSRKLLLHKRELLNLGIKSKQQKLQIVPIKLYNKGRLIKLEFALGKPKKKFEKRETIKRKDLEREVVREVRGRK